jgi:hypothetical protein
MRLGIKQNGSPARTGDPPCEEFISRSEMSTLPHRDLARLPGRRHTGGRLICPSTPYGKRGFFYNCWAKGGDDWHRIEIQATSVSRIPATFLEEERRAQGESWFRQEYC